MKIIDSTILLIGLLCATNAYCVDNKDIQCTFHRNARLNKATESKLEAFIDNLVEKTANYYELDPLYKFTNTECSEYFLDPLGKKYAIFSDSKFVGIYTINGYSITVNVSNSKYIYEINSDYKFNFDSNTINLFNIDFKNIPQAAKLIRKENKDIFKKYLSEAKVHNSNDTIKEVYGIDIDKNRIEDIVILSECIEEQISAAGLTIIMNYVSNPTIFKIGDKSFPFEVNGFNSAFDISFIDYDNKQPVLLSINEGVSGSGFVGTVLYSFEKDQFKPLFSDFSYED
ncbi:MAG: hypothetical protein GX654_09610 [Desulfatiglans sp.]|nr:hypothetical protein [Desulfatiglans sp.]